MKDLSRKLKLQGKEEYRELREGMAELLSEGLIASDAQGRIGYVRQVKPRREPHAGGRVTGRLEVTKRGFGFVTVDETGEQIFISPRAMRTALHGDIVRVARFARPVTPHRGRSDDTPEGEIVEIVSRTVTTLTGRLEEGGHFSFVVPDDQRFTRDIYLSKDEASKARHGDKVVVKLMPWNDEHLNPEGTIEEVLGPSGDARVEVTSVARSFGLPMNFPAGVTREADALPATIPPEEIRSRIDCRSQECVTIDPEDAKDFDDALSVEELDGGTVRLGVHIADVSHYVRQGSMLDAEAFSRGTSVYMANEVVPMLPERLSNDLCSLRPEVDRLTYSVFMDVDREGNVGTYRIGKSVIRSARRFTYEEVQHIIEARRGDFADTILRLFALSRTLLRRRRQNGSIDFDTEEAKFTFDPSGLPTQIIKKQRLDAHRLVEECMLLANRTVAGHILESARAGRELPFLYRVHDVPDPSRMAELAAFVKQFGYSLDARNGVTSRALQKLLDRVEGSEVENVINEVALRSMAKAVYAEKNIGHYGLAFKYYTHFTSPIRRYPDLVVHRLLHEYDRGVSAHRLAELRKAMPGIARQSSERERLAAEAERTSVKVMQVEYMKRHLGDEFEGVIAGVTNFGLFVEINDLLVEGLVSVRDLSDDYYLFDEKHYALRGRSRGRIYRLGDTVRVKVVAVKPEVREIDLTLVP